MKNLKHPTVGILLATLIFSNIHVYPLYGYESENVVENINKQNVESNDTNVEYNNNESEENYIVDIKDTNLKSAINKELNKDLDSDITRSQLKEIRELSMNNKGIKTLEGIEYCINLESLSLDDNNIKDISLLSNLTKLKSLSLNWNKNISDIKALSGLVNLETLYLHDNNISDISALSGLNENLRYLSVSKANISNISALKELTNLEYLALSYNNISDITALSNMTNLKSLHISGNEINNISTLSNMTNLTYLSLYANNITDIKPLEKLGDLETLILYSNEIEDISALKNTTNLQNLNLHNNKIEDISALEYTTKLQNLNLSNNKIRNIKPLSELNPDASNINTDIGDKLYVDLASNPIDLNNSENMKVIKLLKDKGYEIDYDKLNDEENEDSIYNDYKYRVSDSEITITRYFGKDKNITIPSEIDGMKVVEIEDRAFEGCSNLISVKIPEGIRSIGVMVFLECNNLIDIEVDNNNKAYKSIDGILYSKDGTKIILFPNRKTNVTIGQEVTSIEDYAFYGCSSLSSIEIPKGVTSIGYSALANCSNLKDIKIDKNNKEYKSIDGVLYSKDGTKIITVPGGKSNINIFEEVISIENDAFNGCSNLTSIKIPEGVTSIGRWAFDGCSSLKSIEIPKSVTLIGEYAFNGCSSLTSIKIPEGVKKIGGMTFSGCSSLKSIEIPKSVTLIEEYALSENLTTIYGYTGSYAESYAKEFNISFKALENLPIKNIEGTVIEEGNGTEASPLVLLLQEEKAIDELISNLENIFEYNIVGEPVIENNYKIYTLKLNNKVVRTNEYIKSNEDSSYIKLKVDLDDESTINKLDKIFIKDSEGGSSGGGSMLPPTQGNINGGGSIVKPSVTENKLVGTDRYQTAIKVSNEGWNKSESVVLVNSSAIVDALSATPFAKMKDAPILLTEKNTLNSETKKEITRLKAKNVYVIGGNNVISDSIINELKSMNINIERISGDDRYKTSLEIAKRLGDISEIAVVNGVTGLPDAISIAPVAASKKMPIVLASPTEGTKVFDEYMKDKNIKTSYVIGREAAISNEIANKLPNSERLGGDDRNDTNAVVIDKFYTSKNLNNIYVAKDGMSKQDDLIDALSVGVLASKQNSPVVIVGKDLNSNQESILSKKQPKKITQVGGNGNENVFNKLVNIFK